MLCAGLFGRTRQLERSDFRLLQWLYSGPSVTEVKRLQKVAVRVYHSHVAKSFSTGGTSKTPSRFCDQTNSENVVGVVTLITRGATD